MTHRLRQFTLLLALCAFGTQLRAQNTITTQPLDVTSVCPGSTLNVIFTRTGSFTVNSFSVQLSDGGDYKTIATGLAAYNNKTNAYAIPATIPADQAAGTTYRLRVTSSSPAVIGSPSPTVLSINRLNKPTVAASVLSLCQFQQSSPLSAFATSGAVLVWYGTNATGGTGSPTATLPSTTTAGTFKYYVAQKLNDCESERAEITVEIKAASPAPTVSAVSYCQGAQAGQLSAVAASGGTLNWYTSASGGTASPAGPMPSTTNVGIVNYYVSQTVSGSCESQRIVLPVTVNAIPSAPSVNSANPTFCQNTPAQPLTASGQNLKWYDAPSGGTAALSIIPSTTAVGTKSFYVSQTVNNCEGPRTAVTVTVREAPSAPVTSKTSYSFCFGATNTTISADLTSASNAYTWYGNEGQPTLTNKTTAGTSVSATVPPTQVGTFTYWITRTVNGCESAASSKITVTINAVPTAPGVQAIAVCQGATAPVLQPGGENLLWYAGSTGGTGSATAPVVSTSQTSQTTYYVSQSVNGCESPRAALSVTVNALPGVPAVANTGPAYCQNAQAAPIAATGQGLKWYRESSGGTSLGNAFTPETKEAGNFTYYVSQTINGCESSRSSLTVKVTALPSAPSVTNTYSYCQRATASALTATGNSLKWYEPGGKVGDAAPTPSTNEPGTVSYFVTQSAEGCESPRSEIKVTTKPTPSAPGTAALSVCQNEPTRTLSANGQNLQWYTAETGGSGTGATPSINTGQPGQTNYYVSQTLDGCEGPRSALSVTVKPLPSAPGVTQKDICQFVQAEALSASGVGLTWYSPDGSRGPTNPTPATDKGATFSYGVTQTIDGCEGPKATLTVNILTTPAPTVSKTTVELCQGTTAQPLEASGTNLKWSDPNGNVTTTAPVPPTLNATQKPEGDVYYVTQTGTNGCASPKVGIRVFVQTTPTMALVGTTTTNLGLDVPLKLTFTGVGPYRYKLSNGLTGTATKDTTVLVLPDRTTTYQVVEVANKCGVGLPGNGATATITVLVPGIQTLAFTTTTLCAGSSLATGFTTTGVFNPGSVFKLQLAKVETDSAKIKFVDLAGGPATGGQIIGTIPSTTPAGAYWVRVMATNPKIPINGNVSPTLLTVRSLATATLTGNQTVYEGQPANLTVTFAGDGPWTVSYRDSSATALGTAQTIQTTTNPYVFEVRPVRTTTYKINAVSNGCGSDGTQTGSSVVVTVAPLLGIDDQPLAAAVDVYPMPATTTLTVRIRGLSPTQPARLELTDLTGRTTIRQETRRETSVLTLDEQPSGIYILHIRVGDRMTSRRILKL